MSQKNKQAANVELVPVQVVTEIAAPETQRSQNQQPPNPLLVVHRLLRGRYIWAILLALVLAAVGAFSARQFYEPEYRSAGLIQIKPYIPTVLYQTDLTGMMPAFNAFVEQQASLLRDQRVIDLAMQSTVWQETGRGYDPNAIAGFTGSLEVTVPRNSAMIHVAFTDRDPIVAMNAVKAVIEAYQALHGDDDADGYMHRMQILEERRTALASQLRGLNERIQGVAHEFGSSALERMYEFKVEQVQKLERELKELELMIAFAEGAPPGEEMTPDDPAALAAIDSQMREFAREKAQLERETALLALRYGENHRRMVERRFLIEQVEVAMQKRMEEIVAGGSGAIAISGMSVDQLRSREHRIRAMYEDSRAEAVELGRKNLTIQNLQNEAEMVQARLDETRSRIEHLSVESAAKGRVTVVSKGDRPLRPYKDRTVALTGLGAGGGAGLGAGLVVLFGLLRPRLRNIEDARVGIGPATRMLGVLPTLPDDIMDSDEAAVAANCVHHIRALLQMGREGADRRVLTITSAMPNDGKTTLTLALGISFATSKAKTLLIDCDMVGGGLTSRVNASVQRKIGRILRREGLLTDDELQEALKYTYGSMLDLPNSGKRLGEVLLKMGYLTESELKDALERQRSDQVGLLDAMSGEPLDDCVAETGIPGLSILPLGGAGAQHVAQLSPGAFRRILDEARQKYDMILIDTGPVLGSLEACVATVEADEVVFTVSRGASRAMAEKAVNQLHTIGARLAGIVFNRAESQDMVRSGYSSTRSLQSTMDQSIVAAARMPRMGPVAAAVATSSSTDEDYRS